MLLRRVALQSLPSKGIRIATAYRDPTNPAQIGMNFLAVPNKARLDSTPSMCLPVKCDFHTSCVLEKVKGKKAKGKNKGKSSDLVDIPAALEDYLDMEGCRVNYNDILDTFKEKLITSLVLTASAETVARIKVVDSKGEKVPLSRLSRIIQKSPELIIVDMSGNAKLKQQVVDTIRSVGIGVQEQSDNTLYLTISKVTQEKRKDLVKQGKVLLNRVKKDMDHAHEQWNHRLRPKEMDGLKFSKDDLFAAKQNLVTLVREYHDLATEVWKKKEEELLK